ncbi:hypothetical protein R50073_45670 [Maricurvus nonylphenolicus]|uniref:hypothetical protein n=1 Tax=Maricurvus nonylphenolicus TaxID=1008307 RepID=UPI0036F26BEC
MKLEKGKDYKFGFLVVAVLWGIFSFLPYPNSPSNPIPLGFSLAILCLVFIQVISGVALDRKWVASITRSENADDFWVLIFGQALIALLLASSAYQ